MHKGMLLAFCPLLPPPITTVSLLFTEICGSTAKLGVSLKPNFIVLISMLALWSPLGPLHHLVSGTFSHLDSIKIIYTLS